MGEQRVVRNRELWELGQEVLRELHPELTHFCIEFVFIDPPRTKQGQALAGSALKANVRERCLLGIDGWVEIAYYFWAGEGQEWQRYLLDHELEHFEVRDGKLCTTGHEIEDFYDVVRRHGTEIAGLTEIGQMARQVTNGYCKRGDGSTEESGVCAFL